MTSLDGGLPRMKSAVRVECLPWLNKEPHICDQDKSSSRKTSAVEGWAQSGFFCSRHAMHEWIPTKIYGGSCLGVQLHRDPMTTPSHRADDDCDDYHFYLTFTVIPFITMFILLLENHHHRYFHANFLFLLRFYDCHCYCM